MINKDKIGDLASRYIEGTATEPELNELHQWYESLDLKEEAVVVTDAPETREALRQRMLGRLLEEIEGEKKPVARVLPLGNNRKMYWAAAAVGLGLLIGGYFFMKPGIPEKQDFVNTTIKNDLQPGGNRAILQLADGTKIILDSASNGMVAMQGATSIVKTADGQLTYQGGAVSGDVAYNTISIPAGGEYGVVLPDGSKVWLNSLSTLRFPTAFNSNDRNVELTGEGYFEVAKNKEKPFKVEVGEAGTPAFQEVEVLGTHFNIKAYSDEPIVKTTLLEGKVKVTVPAAQKVQTILPGEQLQTDEKGNTKLLKDVDTEEIMGWHYGLFRFKEVPIEEIMNQAKRWYNIEVIYKGKVEEHFVSTIPRQANLKDFIKILETTGSVKFGVDGNTVTVSSVR